MQKYVVGLGYVTVDDRLPPVRKPSVAKERHREIVKTWQNVGYDFFSLLTVTRFLLQYLSPEEGSRGLPDRPPLGGMYAQLATSLLGVNLRLDSKGKPVWRLAGKDLPRCEKRLRSAGIDPETWKVFDVTAATAAWFQLRSQRYYSQKKQTTLMTTASELPNLSIPLKFNYAPNEKQVRTWQLSPAQQHFKGKIHERLEGDGYIP